MTDTERLDAVTKMGIGLMFRDQPTMGGCDWMIRHPDCRNMIHFRNPREAIDYAVTAITNPTNAQKMAMTTQWEGFYTPEKE